VVNRDLQTGEVDFAVEFVTASFSWAPLPSEPRKARQKLAIDLGSAARIVMRDLWIAVRAP